MESPNPFSESTTDNDQDLALVRLARTGSHEALEQLVERHQRWIYNIVRRMTFNRPDAEDATQEILIKLVTGLSTFEQRSRFRTWLYRIVVNHVLNMRRGRSEAHELTFSKYTASLDAAPDADLPDQRSVPQDVQLLVEEAKTVCTTAVLLCLDREQRLVFILSDIFDVSSRVGAELLEITDEAFRQKVRRARRDLYSFLHGQCGLVNVANPCRCAKKTTAFMAAGYVDPRRLLFLSEHVTRVRDVVGDRIQTLEALDEQYGAIYRDHPMLDAPNFVASLRQLIDGAEARSVLDDNL